jgi:copper chaperone CopZ
MTHTYNITGMTCGGCVAKVKSAILKLGDVLSAEVKQDAPQATITMQKHIPLSVLQEAIGHGGKYTITEADVAMPHHMAADDTTATGDSYYPIFLIFGYIAGITLIIQAVMPQFSFMMWIQHFMAGFFLVFSFFKLLNLNGFAEGYSTYDIIAKRIKGYGYVYPFIELGLGIALLTGFQPLLTNIITVVVVAVSTIGVAQSLLKKTPFQCACLGTIIKLPLSKVTLFEDVLMVVMGLIMIGLLA